VLQILFFGELRAITGLDRFEASARDLNGLRQLLYGHWPELQSKTFTIAVNRKIQSSEIVLNDGDEIALMPPFSGG
jgi:molybdopterin converting factor small subunit